MLYSTELMTVLVSDYFWRIQTFILSFCSLLSCVFFNNSRYDGLHHGSSYLEHLHFLSVIKGESIDAPAISLMDGLLSVAIGVAAQLSIEKGCFITIQEILQC